MPNIRHSSMKQVSKFIAFFPFTFYSFQALSGSFWANTKRKFKSYDKMYIEDYDIHFYHFIEKTPF